MELDNHVEPRIPEARDHLLSAIVTSPRGTIPAHKAVIRLRSSPRRRLTSHALYLPRANRSAFGNPTRTAASADTMPRFNMSPFVRLDEADHRTNRNRSEAPKDRRDCCCRQLRGEIRRPGAPPKLRACPGVGADIEIPSPPDHLGMIENVCAAARRTAAATCPALHTRMRAERGCRPKHRKHRPAARRRSWHCAGRKEHGAVRILTNRPIDTLAEPANPRRNFEAKHRRRSRVMRLAPW